MSPLMTDLFILLMTVGLLFGVIFTLAYWFLRILVAAIGYEFNRGTKALRKWAEQ